MSEPIDKVLYNKVKKKLMKNFNQKLVFINQVG